MTEMNFKVTFTAIAEVRDAEGNLISSSPVEFDHELTEQDLRDKGLTDAQITEIKEQDL